MNLYKFRRLESDEDFKRIKECLSTGKFYCSEFSDLNDPMEGVFTASEGTTIKEALNLKKRYKICSFSSRKGLENPCMWGYYANAFKGIAIEIELMKFETSNKIIKDIKYENNLPELDTLDENKVKTVLTSKMKSWEHECEWRLLVQSDEYKHKIGEIKAVYFGNPYGETLNKKEIINRSIKKAKFNCYHDKKKELIKWIREKRPKIEIFEVKVENGFVVPYSDLKGAC